MIPISWNSRERVIVGVGAALVVSALVGTRLAPRWMGSLDGARARNQVAKEMADEARALLGGLPALVDSLEARTGLLISHLDYLIVADSDDAARAALGGLVSETARTRRVRLETNVLTSDATPASGLVLVHAAVTGATDAGGLARWLSTLEGGRPLVRVGELSIRQPNATAPRDEPEELAFEGTLSALALLKEGPAHDN